MSTHDPPVFLFALGFFCASGLAWALLRRARKTVAVWPFVVAPIVLTAVASLVYLELFFRG